jgi:hypothetical protein
MIEQEINIKDVNQEFDIYLKEKAKGNTDSIIRAFNNNEHNEFKGYVTVREIITEGVSFMRFYVDNTRIFADWKKEDNYAIWTNFGHSYIDYDGYMLFPTKEPDIYFCLAYKLK